VPRNHKANPRRAQDPITNLASGSYFCLPATLSQPPIVLAPLDDVPCDLEQNISRQHEHEFSRCADNGLQRYER